jgi:hypothetical protein
MRLVSLIWKFTPTTFELLKVETLPRMKPHIVSLLYESLLKDWTTDRKEIQRTNTVIYSSSYINVAKQGRFQDLTVRKYR